MIDQRIHQCGLSRIGIADHGYQRKTALPAHFPLCLPALRDLLQLFPKHGHPPFDMSSVELDLHLAGSLIGKRSASAALPG